MLLPTRKVNARIRKKTQLFGQIFGRELSEVLFSVAFGLSGLTNFSQLHNLPAFFVIARARPPLVSLYTIYISAHNFFLCCPWYSLCARDSRYFKIITSPHSKKKLRKNINIVMRAYRLALARSHLISQVTTHFNIELSFVADDDEWLWRV